MSQTSWEIVVDDGSVEITHRSPTMARSHAVWAALMLGRRETGIFSAQQFEVHEETGERRLHQEWESK